MDVYRHDGKRTTISLPGEFGSEESKAEYQRVLAILQANGGRLPATLAQRTGIDLSISELVVRFMREKVLVDYVDADGKPTSEQLVYRQAVKPLLRMCGPLLAKEFDAASLDAVRQTMASGSWMNEGERAFLAKCKKPANWSRGTVNKSVSRIRSLFRWAVLRKIIPPSVVTDLECLPPLRRGRGGARETVPVAAVAPEVVEATPAARWGANQEHSVAPLDDDDLHADADTELDAIQRRLRGLRLRELKMWAMQIRLGFLSREEFDAAREALPILRTCGITNVSPELVEQVRKVAPVAIISRKREAGLSIEADKQRLWSEIRVLVAGDSRLADLLDDATLEEAFLRSPARAAGTSAVPQHRGHPRRF